jgi:hypothetical protein
MECQWQPIRLTTGYRFPIGIMAPLSARPDGDLLQRLTAGLVFRPGFGR